ncbi:hypothetical protein DEU56DRAFT_762043 [Suillus clintonianus]|uniref:uncharacterized protein n=1 Tax=Suillus clintonianus TaxID=1904413 RepID=UPI001B85D798|nr:uncharacterized protein DEU56DRAFT_762043 [Suillus clintonianus]KAG2112436.1 hypothetical protein DEU56DRAFT_762043 [Suillus clintonianus]
MQDTTKEIFQGATNVDAVALEVGEIGYGRNAGDTLDEFGFGQCLPVVPRKCSLPPSGMILCMGWAVGTQTFINPCGKKQQHIILLPGKGQATVGRQKVIGAQQGQESALFFRTTHQKHEMTLLDGLQNCSVDVLMFDPSEHRVNVLLVHKLVEAVESPLNPILIPITPITMQSKIFGDNHSPDLASDVASASDLPTFVSRYLDSFGNLLPYMRTTLSPIPPQSDIWGNMNTECLYCSDQESPNPPGLIQSSTSPDTAEKSIPRIYSL